MHIPTGGIIFFDSGIGGLTVLHTCTKYLPDEVFYYYGDNAHAPYGIRSPQDIRRLVRRAFRKWKRLRPRAVVIACNTATAVCIEELRARYPIPILGVEPAVLPAARGGGEVFILPTSATAQSERFLALYQRAQKMFPTAKLCLKPCPQLAGEIEAHLGDVTYDYKPFLPSGKPTAVVLGCTHYIYIEEEIRAYYGCDVYHGNEGVARQLLRVLNDTSKKNWDERPPSNFLCRILGLLTTLVPIFSQKGKKREKANFCSHKKANNPLKNQAKRQIYFLGENREKNEKTYFRTYVREEK